MPGTDSFSFFFLLQILLAQTKYFQIMKAITISVRLLSLQLYSNPLHLGSVFKLMKEEKILHYPEFIYCCRTNSF